MKDEHLDALLRRAGEAQRADASSPHDEGIDDGAILALQAGELSLEEAEALEARLALDPEARARALALSRAVEPALLERIEGASKVSPRRWSWAPLIAAAAALAIGAGIWLSLADQPTGPLTPAYVSGPLQGAMKTVRGDTPSPTSTFGPESVLRMAFKPAEAVDGQPAVAVFAQKAGAGPLTRAGQAEVTQGAGGAFRVKLSAGPAFGAQAGPRRVAVAIGPLAGSVTEVPIADLKTIEISRETGGVQVEAYPGVRWFVFTIDYVMEEGR